MLLFCWYEDECRCCLRRYTKFALPDAALILLVVCVPIGFAALHETTAHKPPEANADCVRLMTVDGKSHWIGPLCFVKDFGAQWYRNLVEFSALVSADCEVMGEERDKQACAELKQQAVEKLHGYYVAGALGFMAGYGGR